MINQVLHTLLAADASYAAKMSDPNGGVKLYPNRGPQGVQRPYAVWTRVSRVENHDKDARGMTRHSIQMDHFANTTDEADELDALAIAVLDRYKGTVAGVKISSIRVIGGSGGSGDAQEDRRALSEFLITENR